MSKYESQRGKELYFNCEMYFKALLFKQLDLDCSDNLH